MLRLIGLLDTPTTKFFAPLTIIRIAFGLFFFSSGFNKVFLPVNQALMLETIIEAGIPFPEVMAVLVAISEMVFGLFLVLGFLTRLMALGLMVITLVALFTVELKTIPEGLDLMTWYSWLLYLPQSGYILMALLLVVQGSGPWSIDLYIFRKKAVDTQ